MTLTYPLNAPPNIRRGTWILDTTYNPTTGSVNGDFYRVVSMTTVDPTHVSLELQTPIAKQTLVDGVHSLTAVTVMDNVSEVFFRGVGYSSALGVPRPAVIDPLKGDKDGAFCRSTQTCDAGRVLRWWKCWWRWR